ncbi:MAG TPA: cob(I)yrinic acid a,c-diamide adenosyltransferase [Planctomycetota bacterium]|jgi:cob(I)alamin adenosyltransferase|nr:cob(I)yrinic acid a,c-diamide adenosyltransferase [Planctomycetota bacterium]
MVRLTRIYTKTGDDGTTGLGDGSRVSKASPRIEAYGTVDELNATVGVCLQQPGATAFRERLLAIQNDLFDLGADLCVPLAPARARPPGQPGPLRIGAARGARLEGWIDVLNAQLQPLQSFVLPGGGPLACALHVARTVCRRAERRVVELAAREEVNPQCVLYLNRLSDLLFVMARVAAGGDETLWRPTRDDAPGAGA